MGARSQNPPRVAASNAVWQRKACPSAGSGQSSSKNNSSSKWRARSPQRATSASSRRNGAACSRSASPKDCPKTDGGEHVQLEGGSVEAQPSAENSKPDSNKERAANPQRSASVPFRRRSRVSSKKESLGFLKEKETDTPKPEQKQQRQPQQTPSKEASAEAVVPADPANAQECGATTSKVQTCPAGHTLEDHLASLKTICATCGLESEQGSRLLSCRQCDFDLCTACRWQSPSEPAAAEPPHEGPAKDAEVEDVSPARVEGFEAFADPTMCAPTLDYSTDLVLPAWPQANMDNMMFWLPEPVAFVQAWIPLPCAAVMEMEHCWEMLNNFGGFTNFTNGFGHVDSSSTAMDWAGAAAAVGAAGAAEPEEEMESMAMDGVLLEGNETTEGPDGELYEVFYPSSCAPENFMAEVETIAPGSQETSPRGLSTSSSSSWVCEGCAVPSMASLPECFEEAASEGHSKTIAEQWIEDIVHFMCNLSYERHPSRVRLFETVQGAVVGALGEHFERLALVGSTALRIDTPDSDLDAVAFTRCGASADDGTPGSQPPMAAEALRWIAELLAALDGTLNLQLVDCTRVPVLTISTCDGQLSLDLTIDQYLSESHVLWFQSQQAEPWRAPAPLHSVPAPLTHGWEQGLDAATLRCIKWWLRRRRLPVAKEGGYPTFVWTLMVIYVLRCSLLVQHGGDASSGGVSDKVPGTADARTLLAAIAAFFDRFAEGGLRGRLFFQNGTTATFQDNLEATASGAFAELSVLDPTTTDDVSMACGVAPNELAPQISMATQLLYVYELKRAQYLTATVLASEAATGGYAQVESNILRHLFSDVDERQNLLPANLFLSPMPTMTGLFILCNGQLHLGILREVHLKPGWTAPFLHRCDDRSELLAQLCTVDAQTGSVTALPGEEGSDMWFHPCDFVCQAFLRCEASCPDQGFTALRLEDEALERWVEMHALLGNNPRVSVTRGGGSGGGSVNGRGGSGKLKKAARRLKKAAER